MYAEAMVAVGPSRDMVEPGVFTNNPDGYAPQFEQRKFSAPAASLHAEKRHEGHDTQDTQDLDELERAEATPRASFGTDPLSPRQPTRRTSGRRPLSILSNSSLNSDLSPPSDHRSPDQFSPSRHRRHRSMIGASVDYRHHYPQCGGLGVYYQPPYAYANPFQSPNMQHSHSHQHPPTNNSIFTPHHYPSPSQPMNPYAGQSPSTGGHSGTYHSMGHAHDPLVIPSPLIGSSHTPFQHPLHSPLSPQASSSEVPAALSVAAAAAATTNGIQDIFVALAYKERRVLEAKQTWEAAKEDLESFRMQLDSMLAPEREPLILPIRPTIIARRCTPNLGIHSLQYTPTSRSTPRKTSARVTKVPEVALWRIDWEVPSAAQPADLDDMTDPEELARQEQDRAEAKRRRAGIALKVVKCLLGIVHCIISTLPVQQRDFAYRDRTIYWNPEYPMPMDTLFGHLA